MTHSHIMFQINQFKIIFCCVLLLINCNSIAIFDWNWSIQILNLGSGTLSIFRKEGLKWSTGYLPDLVELEKLRMGACRCYVHSSSKYIAWLAIDEKNNHQQKYLTIKVSECFWTNSIEEETQQFNRVKKTWDKHHFHQDILWRLDKEASQRVAISEGCCCGFEGPLFAGRLLSYPLCPLSNVAHYFWLYLTFFQIKH